MIIKPITVSEQTSNKKERQKKNTLEVQRRSLEATRFQLRETTRHRATLRASRLFKTLNIKSLPSRSNGSWQRGRPPSFLIFFLFLSRSFPIVSVAKANPSSISLLWFSCNSWLLVCAIEVEEEKGGGMRIIFAFFLFSIFVCFLCCRVARLVILPNLSNLHILRVFILCFVFFYVQ